MRYDSPSAALARPRHWDGSGAPPSQRLLDKSRVPLAIGLSHPAVNRKLWATVRQDSSLYDFVTIGNCDQAEKFFAWGNIVMDNILNNGAPEGM